MGEGKRMIIQERDGQVRRVRRQWTRWLDIGLFCWFRQALLYSRDKTCNV